MGGTPADATVCALEVVAAKNCLAVDIASSAVDAHAVQITGSGATADNKALLNLAWGAVTPANAGANILRVDGSAITATNKPVLVEIIGTGKTVQGLSVDADPTDKAVVLINGSGATADNNALLHVTSDGTMVGGSSLVRVESSTAAAGATVYGLEIACNAANLEGLFVSAGTSLFTETATFTAGYQAAAVAVTATDTGATTGTIPDGARNVTVNWDGDANHIVILPTPTPGTELWIFGGATGGELRSSAPATVAINGGAESNAESAVGANVNVHCICTSATTWVCNTFAADGTEAKLEVAAA
jgi:hypothetical protein